MLADWNIAATFFKGHESFSWNVFSNTALTCSKDLTTDAHNIKGNKVEFVPTVNVKAGTGIGYKNFMASVQVTYLSSQFTDSNNSVTDSNDNTYGIFGEIPSYYVADFSASYKWKNFKLEAGINNFTDNHYFTRRATGYPGPGIIPSDPLTFYTTIQFIL
jgi:Fe(3+) dicitrate transport protein